MANEMVEWNGKSKKKNWKVKVATEIKNNEKV